MDLEQRAREECSTGRKEDEGSPLAALLSSGSYGITSQDYCVGKNFWALDDLYECIIANALIDLSNRSS
jgi:hypothetical protein